MDFPVDLESLVLGRATLTDSVVALRFFESLIVENAVAESISGRCARGNENDLWTQWIRPSAFWLIVIASRQCRLATEKASARKSITDGRIHVQNRVYFELECNQGQSVEFGQRRMLSSIAMATERQRGGTATPQRRHTTSCTKSEGIREVMIARGTKTVWMCEPDNSVR